MVKVSIVIPAYNEEKRIRRTLGEYATYFTSRYGREYEMWVIVNGCTDRTMDVVRDVATQHPQMKYTEFREKIGKGGAIIEGLKRADGEMVGFVDADNATKPAAFEDLIRHIGAWDGIIASRWIAGARILKRQPGTRRVASRGFNLLVKLLFQIPLRDTQCGAKLFKKAAIKKVLPSLGVTQWAFDIDLLYHLKKNGLRVAETPTVWEEPGDSHLKLKKTIPEMLLAVVRLRLVYSPLGFIVRGYDWLFVKEQDKRKKP